MSFVEWVKGKPFFDYQKLGEDKWREKVREARRQFKVEFDTENDDGEGQRLITVDQSFWDFTKCQFRCELRSAGGDWEIPIYYFRCQITKGHAYGVTAHGDPFFCVIPCKEGGNYHLVRTHKGWRAPVEEDEGDREPSKAACWKFLKGYLNGMVEKEIANIKRENERRGESQEGGGGDESAKTPPPRARR